MGADHWANLGEHERVVTKDLAATLGELLGLTRCLDVLDHVGVGAILVARTQQVDHPLERAL